MVEITAWPKKSLILLIKGYQLVVSPMLGPRCRFYPSCSTYGIQAIEKFGFLKGFRMILIRLLKCHPFHPGGIDLVP